MKRYLKTRIAIISSCLVLIIALAATFPEFTATELTIALKFLLSALLKVS